MALISVIVPCYNYGRFLPDAIHSLIGGPTCRGQSPPQTLTDFEAIIVNDASTDGSNHVAADLSTKDDRVAFFTLFKNSGTAAALNAGIRSAQGEYIYILSADDLIEPWTLELMLSACESNPHKVCYGDLKTITGGVVVKNWPLTNYSFHKVVTKNPIPAAGVMYPKACWEDVGGYPEVMRWGREGWAFNIDCGLKGWPGHHIGTFCGYLYRWDGQNRSEKTSGKTPQYPPPRCETWREFYQCQVARLYPDLYKRSESMCCGEPVTKPRGAANTPPPTVKQNLSLPGKGGFSIVEYIGPSDLDQTYWVEQTPYSFGAKKVGYVAKDHLSTMLGMRGKRKETLFVEVVPPPHPTPPPPPPPAPIQVEEKQEESQKDLDTKTEPTPDEPNATGNAIILAEAHEGVKLSQIRGSGTDGRILKKDVQAHIEDLEAKGKAPWLENEEVEA